MANNDIRAAIDEAANALQTAVVLATHLRQTIGQQVDEAVKLEAAVERAAKALKRVSPGGGAR